MNKNNKNNKIGKDISIEDKLWDKLKLKSLDWKIQKNDNSIDTGDIISELLVKYSRKEITFERLTISKKKKNKKVYLTEEANQAYEQLPNGTKTYVVNNLIRRWVK